MFAVALSILIPITAFGRTVPSAPSPADLAKPAAERAAKPKIAAANQPALPPSEQVMPSQPVISGFLRGTSIDTLVPTTIIFENAPDIENNQRGGARLDMFGQATETLRGNAANELRPEFCRIRNLCRSLGQRIDSGLRQTGQFARYRRQLHAGDFSNQAYFYTDLLSVLKREQNAATLEVVRWFGPKDFPW